MPRWQARAQPDGKDRKARRQKPKIETRAARKIDKGLLAFMQKEGVSCPSWLPMLDEDTVLKPIHLLVAQHIPEIPMTEIIRKEYYWRCSSSFEQALGGNPKLFSELIRAEIAIQKKILGIENLATRFTEGDYRRFCAVIYLLTKFTLQNCEIAMRTLKRKRLMPKFLMTNLLASEVIPWRVYQRIK